MWQWLLGLFAQPDPFDVDLDDESAPSELDCPTTQPTAPGALDSDLGRL